MTPTHTHGYYLITYPDLNVSQKKYLVNKESYFFWYDKQKELIRSKDDYTSKELSELLDKHKKLSKKMFGELFFITGSPYHEAMETGVLKFSSFIGQQRDETKIEFTLIK